MQSRGKHEAVVSLCVQGNGTYTHSRRGLEEWNHGNFRGRESGVLPCEPFFHVVSWLLFLWVQRELCFSLVMGPHVCPVGSPVSSFSRDCWALGFRGC
jgi:hypothetical protein